MTLNSTGIGYVDDLKEQAAGDVLNAVQQYDLPSAAQLLLYSNLNGYVGLNLLTFTARETKFFATIDFGGTIGFTPLNLSAATDAVSSALNRITDRIDDIQTSVLPSTLTPKQREEVQRELDALAKLTKSVGDIPQNVVGSNLKPINDIVPMFYYGPSINLGKGIGKNTDEIHGFYIQGYAQYLVARSTKGVANLLYNTQENTISTAEVPLNTLKDVGINVVDGQTVNTKKFYNPDIVNIGARIQFQKNFFVAFAGVQYTMSVNQNQSSFFSNISQKEIFSYNLGVLFDLTNVSKKLQVSR